MIVRIVKLTFKEGKGKEFPPIFESAKDKIRACKGCTHLEVLNDIHDPDVFMTYSHWDSESDLLAYRDSELFNYTWALVKPLFAVDAEAWSLNKLY